MTKDRKKKQIIIFVVLILSVLCININTGVSKWINYYDYDVRTSSTYYDVIIDDTSANNWTWAKNQGYCTGTGTIGDPYLIEGHDFRVTNYTASLTIRNSVKYFKIRSCNFRSSEFGIINATGLYLHNVTNGHIQESAFSYFIMGITAINCNLTTFFGLNFEFSNYGIEINSCFNNTFQENEFYQIYNKSLSLLYSNRNIIFGNFIQQSEDGLYLFNSHYNEVTGGVIHRNNGTGIYLYASSNNIFVSVTSAKNGEGIILSYSTNNQFIMCSSSNNYGTGLKIDSGGQNIIDEGNFYNNSKAGINLELSINNSILDSQVWYNNGEGITLMNCIYSTLVGNNIEKNLLDGILSIGSSFNQIRANKIILNHYEELIPVNYSVGINLIISSFNTIKDNIIEEYLNSSGISLISSIGNNIINNRVEGPTDFDYSIRIIYSLRNTGINLLSSSDNNIVNNYIFTNDIGIYLKSSDNNLISTNTIDNVYSASEMYGILMDNSTHNFIFDNIITKIFPENCIVERDCHDNILSGNSCNQDTFWQTTISLGSLTLSLGLNLVLLILFIRKRKKIRGD